MISKKSGAGLAVTKENLRKIRRQLHDAYAFVQARETTEAINNITFNELIATGIKELVGDDSSGKRDVITLYDGNKEVKLNVTKPKVHGRFITTKLDRVNAIENTISQLIDRLKKTDPAAFKDASLDANDSDNSSRRP